MRQPRAGAHAPQATVRESPCDPAGAIKAYALWVKTDVSFCGSTTGQSPGQEGVTQGVGRASSVPRLTARGPPSPGLEGSREQPAPGSATGQTHAPGTDAVRRSGTGSLLPVVLADEVKERSTLTETTSPRRMAHFFFLPVLRSTALCVI